MFNQGDTVTSRLNPDFLYKVTVAENIDGKVGVRLFRLRDGSPAGSNDFYTTDAKNLAYPD